MSTIPASDVQADLESVCERLLVKKTVDPELQRRVRERADAVRDELRQKGLTNLALDLLRESRDE
jgi:hypothetical protein